MKGSTSAAPVIWCAVSAALFGASTPASKPLLQHFGPLFLSGLLYLGAALVVAPWALRNVPSLRTIDRRNAGRLAGAVVFGGVVGPVLLLMGLSQALAGSVALWLNLESVATALLATWFFKEHLGRSTWLSVVLIVVASALLSPATPGGGWALLLVALACVAWGLDNNWTSVIDQVSPAQITFVKGLCAGSFNLALGIAFERADVSPGPLAAALSVGALSYGVSLLLYVAGAQHLGATRSQLLFSTAPAWGLGLAWLALGEPMSLSQAGAAGLMGFAIWLWYRERHEHRHTHQRMVHRHFHRHDDGHHGHVHEPPVPAGAWHSHEHVHEPLTHEHAHRPDLHHRHEH